MGKIYTFFSTEKYKFHNYKSNISINDTDINKIVFPNQFPFGEKDFKYLIGYKDFVKFRLLCMFPPQMILYKINFEKNRHVFLNKRRRSFY